MIDEFKQKYAEVLGSTPTVVSAGAYSYYYRVDGYMPGVLWKLMCGRLLVAEPGKDPQEVKTPGDVKHLLETRSLSTVIADDFAAKSFEEIDSFKDAFYKVFGTLPTVTDASAPNSNHPFSFKVEEFKDGVFWRVTDGGGLKVRYCDPNGFDSVDLTINRPADAAGLLDA